MTQTQIKQNGDIVLTELIFTLRNLTQKITRDAIILNTTIDYCNTILDSILNKDDLVKLQADQDYDTSKLTAYNIPKFITAVNKLEKADELTDYQECISNFKAILDDYRCEQSREELKQEASAISEAQDVNDIEIELPDTIQQIKTTKDEEYIEGYKLLWYTPSQIIKIKSQVNDKRDEIQTQFNDINQKVTDLLGYKEKLQSALQNIQTQYKQQLITQINKDKTFKIAQENFNITFDKDAKSVTVEVKNVFFEKQIVKNLRALSAVLKVDDRLFTFSTTITATIDLDKLKNLQTSSVAVNKSESHLQEEVKGGGNSDNRIVSQELLKSQGSNLQSRIDNPDQANQASGKSSTKAKVTSINNRCLQYRTSQSCIKG
jgi:hypothetical protein